MMQPLSKGKYVKEFFNKDLELRKIPPHDLKKIPLDVVLLDR